MVRVAAQGGSISVPAQYDPLVQEMSQATGIPYNVIAAQANVESGFNARAVSSAGAQGWLQFLPSTYKTYATQAGVGQNTEFDPASEAKVYDVYMKSLLSQEGGSVQKALAAYNAGPGNLSAGMGYANQILNAAGAGTNITAGQGQLTGNPITSTAGSIITDMINTVLGMLGLSSLKDMFERLGLIILGVLLLIVGIHVLSKGNDSPININTEQMGGGSTKRKTSSGSGKASITSAEKSATKTGASEAVEAAAVA